MQRRCSKAPNNWMDGKCEEVETRFRIGKVEVAHRKTKESFWQRRIDVNIVCNKNGRVLTESRDKVSRLVDNIW